MNRFFGKPAPASPSHHIPALERRAPTSALQRGGPQDRRQVYAKVFRWKPPVEFSGQPASVEIAGSFTNWRRVAMVFDPRSADWHVTVPNIPAGKTHHYMLLVDGVPTMDRFCDGLALPVDAQEQAHQIQTERGPRVFMLFAQAK